MDMVSGDSVDNDSLESSIDEILDQAVADMSMQSSARRFGDVVGIIADQPLSQHVVDSAAPVVNAISNAAATVAVEAKRAAGIDTNNRLDEIEEQLRKLVGPTGTINHVFDPLNVVHEHVADLDTKVMKLQEEYDCRTESAMNVGVVNSVVIGAENKQSLDEPVVSHPRLPPVVRDGKSMS